MDARTLHENRIEAAEFAAEQRMNEERRTDALIRIAAALEALVAVANRAFPEPVEHAWAKNGFELQALKDEGWQEVGPCGPWVELRRPRQPAPEGEGGAAPETNALTTNSALLEAWGNLPESDATPNDFEALYSDCTNEVSFVEEENLPYWFDEGWRPIAHAYNEEGEPGYIVVN